MIFGSVCSGIEAASVAWEPMGWSASWFAEIEAFPSAVLEHHWPAIPNLGDMTCIAKKIKNFEALAPDVLVGGTPCQAFSVAGLREGLSDSRGQLTLSYVELLNAIDAARYVRGELPAIAVWENVPGVLSSKDNAFGCFLAALAGEDQELQPSGKKWTNSGCVFGPQRTVAWRILDAQYFGVAQRRRRVFVVASARDGFDPCKVLFEFDGVRRDIAPSREAQESVAGTLDASLGRGRGAGTSVAALTANGVGTCGADDNQAQAGHLIVPLFSSNGIGSFAPGIGPLRARAQDSHNNLAVMSVHGTQDPGVAIERAHALGRNSGQENAVAYGIPGNWIGLAPENGGNATEPHYDRAPCLTSTDRHGVAHAMTVRRLTPTECERLQGFPDGHTQIPVAARKAITAEEFAYIRKSRPEITAEDAYRLAKDGPRYKALGNSMAVPCMRFIGERINSELSA